MHYVIGTRGSKLALAQAMKVKNSLELAYREDTFEIKAIRTTGDIKPDHPLEEIGSRGIFTDEIEKELLSGEIALAVHSMKDMPGEIDDRLTFAKAWKREDARDVLILKNANSLEELPQKATIGTGSKRRAYQLQQLRPDINIMGIRGNVDTRIKKLHDPEFGLDGIIIAAAGIKRLGRENEVTQYLTFDQVIPAPTQGVLAIELRKDNTSLLEKINALSVESVELAVSLERQFLVEIGGDCHYPIGAYYDGDKFFYALYGQADGSRIARVKRAVHEDIETEDFIKEVVQSIRLELGK